MRIIPHIQWDLINFTDRSAVIVISNYTDVQILLLFYMQNFISYGLKKLFLVTGTGDRKKSIPVHLIQTVLGDSYCKALLKCVGVITFLKLVQNMQQY